MYFILLFYEVMIQYYTELLHQVQKSWLLGRERVRVRKSLLLDPGQPLKGCISPRQPRVVLQVFAMLTQPPLARFYLLPFLWEEIVEKTGLWPTIYLFRSWPSQRSRKNPGAGMRCMDEWSRPLANSLRSVERVAGEELCQRCSGAPDSVEVRVTGKTVNFNKVNC